MDYNHVYIYIYACIYHCHITMERSTMFNGKIYDRFAIVMWYYQRLACGLNMMHPGRLRVFKGTCRQNRRWSPICVASCSLKVYLMYKLIPICTYTYYIIKQVHMHICTHIYVNIHIYIYVCHQTYMYILSTGPPDKRCDNIIIPARPWIPSSEFLWVWIHQKWIDMVNCYVNRTWWCNMMM